VAQPLVACSGEPPAVESTNHAEESLMAHRFAMRHPRLALGDDEAPRREAKRQSFDQAVLRAASRARVCAGGGWTTWCAYVLDRRAVVDEPDFRRVEVLHTGMDLASVPILRANGWLYHRIAAAALIVERSVAETHPLYVEFSDYSVARYSLAGEGWVLNYASEMDERHFPALHVNWERAVSREYWYDDYFADDRFGLDDDVPRL
jgi:hypothetical protein